MNKIKISKKVFDKEEVLFGRSKQELLDLCLSSPFPGTKKWETNNPIWNCNLAKCATPKNAWKDAELLKEALNNLYWITKKSIDTNKYPEFVKRIKAAFEEGGVLLLREVLLRFTIAKIAPKVTALQEATFMRIIEESGIDITNGVYCPMAGFGGIVRGAERWFSKQGLEPKIEAYDINPNFCSYYGWKERDVLAQKIVTDKVVIVCPPFGNETERWEGTPDSMYHDFHDWCRLIKEQVGAPNYIFIGPEIREESKYKSGVKPSGLFKKKYGISWYPKYSNKGRLD